MRLILLFSILINSLWSQTKYVYVINKKPVWILYFKDSTNYQIIEYIKKEKTMFPIAILDSGNYIKFKFAIEFKSKSKEPIIKGIKPFLKNKLYHSWISIETYKQSDTNKYHSFFWKAPIHNKKEPHINNLAAEGYTKQFFINTIHKYAPIYDSLIYTDYSGPGMYKTYINGKYVEWKGDTAWTKLIKDYETVVHESTHGFNSTIGYFNRKFRYKIMVEPGITICYENNRSFQSSQFASIIPPDANKKIFRYDMYVSPWSTVTANLSGIYGLIDEFSAYRNGCHAALISTLKAIELNRERERDIFFEEACATHFSYYEFRLFIAWYLAYGKSNQTQIWKETMENKNLRIAFTLIDDLFLEDIKIIKQLQEKIKFYGYDYYERTYVDYLVKNIPNWQSYIDEFKIEGVNKSNWREMIEKLPSMDGKTNVTKIKDK